MKVFNTVILATVLATSVQVQAEGREEICSRISIQDVQYKNYMNNDSAFIPIYLDAANKSNFSQKVKDSARERIFWIYNRRTLSDDSLQKLSFLRCITGNW